MIISRPFSCWLFLIAAPLQSSEHAFNKSLDWIIGSGHRQWKRSVLISLVVRIQLPFVLWRPCCLERWLPSFSSIFSLAKSESFGKKPKTASGPPRQRTRLGNTKSRQGMTRTQRSNSSFKSIETLDFHQLNKISENSTMKKIRIRWNDKIRRCGRTK